MNDVFQLAYISFIADSYDVENPENGINDILLKAREHNKYACII